MKLEQQCVSLELAKKLKELGMKQESLFYWSDQLNRHITHDEFMSYDPYNEELLQDHDFREAVDRTYSAYTVAELGEMLPYDIEKDGELWFISQFTDFRIIENKRVKVYCLQYETVEHEVLQPSRAETEADARAKMLAYLIENNLLEVAKTIND